MKNNLPVLNHVTLPRLGAFHAIFDELTPVQVTKYGSGNENFGSHDDIGTNITIVFMCTNSLFLLSFYF